MPTTTPDLLLNLTPPPPREPLPHGVPELFRAPEVVDLNLSLFFRGLRLARSRRASTIDLRGGGRRFASVFLLLYSGLEARGLTTKAVP